MLAGPLCEAGADGVLEDVLDGRRQVPVGLDDPGSEAVAEEMAPALVPAVERLGVRSVEALEAVRQSPELGLHDEVVVVRHQAEGVDPPVVPLDFARQEAQEPAIVVAGTERGRARDASCGDVVDALQREFSTRPPHAVTLAARSPADMPRATGRSENRHAFVTIAVPCFANHEGQSLVVGT